ncbi:MAG: RagB/SusD family nutrient uptake outer membrane protein [Bacteroidota bacterium]
MKRNRFKLTSLIAASALLTFSCSDLEIEDSDSIIDESTSEGGTFNGVANVEESLNNVYNQFNGIGDQTNFYALQEVSGDYELVPTRGTDWGDNGIWRTLHSHSWTADHDYVLNVWNNWNQRIFLTSEIIDSRSSPTAQQAAEASFLRAFATWVIVDMFGQVPVRAVDSGPDELPTVQTRTEGLANILADLDVAIAGLSDVAAGDVDNQSRASRQAAQFMKARVLLNAHIYDGSGTPDNANLQEVVNLIDAIAAQGYALEDDYFGIFTEDADNETIWWIPAGVGNRIWNGMHYNIVAPDNGGGGWNGFAVLSEFYDSFEGDPNNNRIGNGQEERRGFVPHPDDNNIDGTLGIGYGMLIGQQYGADGQELKTRPGGPLSFTKDLPGLAGNTEETGIRTIKYHPVNGSFTNHEIMFRYADAHLMKAEAMLLMGGDATAMVNQLRALREATPLGAVSLDDLLAERGRELYKEAIRRTDLIRFGQYTRDWQFKNASSVGDANRNLFPIPRRALLGNPNLVQNPGY